MKDDNNDEIGIINITFQFNDEKPFCMKKFMIDGMGVAITKNEILSNINLLDNIMHYFNLAMIYKYNEKTS